ncbi:MAG: hypothetical protein NTY68_05415 [Candidatus Micrarchaeota archaeon]|nr:hypothetical protein [Candidatus Micrarchaeota archaeon]
MTNKIVLVALIALLVTFGCVGGNQTANSTGAGTTHTTTNTGNGNAAAGGNVAAGTQNNTAGSGSSSANSGSSSSSSSSSTNPLDAILANINQANYKVTYDVASSYSGNTVKMSMVQYVKGKNMRYDTEASGFVTETFVLDKKSYSCINMGQGFTCTESASSEEASATPEDLKSSEDNYNIVPLPDRTIAGIAAKCFNMKVKSGAAEGLMDDINYCFSSDGIILYTGSSVSGGETSMTATAVERGISDSVFTLPATPTAQ